MASTRTTPATASREKHTSSWTHLKHPFRLFYLGVAFLLATFVGSVIQTLITPSSGNLLDNLRQSPIGQAEQYNSVVFWSVVGVCLVLAGIGLVFDRQEQAAASPRQSLSLASNLKASSFKLGDDLAAQAPYVVSPVQEVYLQAVNALHDASIKAPGAKSGLLVMGVANAGKTRLAFEVVRKALPNWRVFVWRVDDVEPANSAFEGEDVVIFIDDLQDHAPSEVRYARGSTQTLDTRALALQKMVLDVRGWARRVIIVATCRTEDEVRTRARMGWLFAELASVEVPLFPLDGPKADTIINEFRDQALQRIKDWDGTIGSLVLGLSAKRQFYAELVIERDPAARALQAMKLLALAGIEKHTEQRLRAICTGVFFRTDLERDDIWREAVDNLVRMQFVTEGTDSGTLIIRKDTYFDQVITDYPATDRPMQLERDTEKALVIFAGLRDVEVMFHLGNAFYRTKQYVQSLDAYERVLTLGAFTEAVPEAVVWRNKGAVLQSQKRLDLAVAAYEKALQLDPKFASAWRNEGDIHQERGNYEAAFRCYDRALAIDPRYVAALNSKGRVLNKMGRPEEALTLFEEALTIDPHYDFAWRQKGDAYSTLKRYDEALVAYDRALEVNPAYGYAWNGKGVVYREMGRLQDALAAFNKAIEIDPSLMYSWSGRGVTLRDLGHYDEALVAIDQALQLKPTYASALKNRGTVLEKLGRYDEALAAFDAALTQDQGYTASAHTGKATVFAAQGRYLDALDEFDRALAFDPAYVNALLGKAQAAEQLGRLDLATELRVRARVATAGGQGADTVEPVEEPRDQEQVRQDR